MRKEFRKEAGGALFVPFATTKKAFSDMSNSLPRKAKMDGKESRISRRRRGKRNFGHKDLLPVAMNSSHFYYQELRTPYFPSVVQQMGGEKTDVVGEKLSFCLLFSDLQYVHSSLPPTQNA